MPPIGESRIEGRKAHAVTVPYSAEEPVRFNKYKGNANRNVAFPNKEMICPMTTKIKSFENNL